VYGALRGAIAGLLCAVAALLTFPAPALGHGPTAPVATSYLDRVGSAPPGLDAKVVDGWVRLWLQVPPSETVEVLDYSGAPYVRFSRAGIEVNTRSEMYYLNLTPPVLPPPGLARTTPPHWRLVSSGHAYLWHDGRLGALTSVAPPVGSSYVGRWTIPVLVDGRLAAISGSGWHAPAPSLVWWWPIVVLLACLLAALRLRRPRLDQNLARAVALLTLAALAVGGAGHELHGRPEVSIAQWIFLGVLAAFVCYALVRLLTRPLGYFLALVIAFVAIWIGAELVPTLTHGFVLIALPAFAARAATVVCLGGGVALLVLVFRLVERESASETEPDADPISVSSVT
jgi:hypothetical protein